MEDIEMHEDRAKSAFAISSVTGPDNTGSYLSIIGCNHISASALGFYLFRLQVRANGYNGTTAPCLADTPPEKPEEIHRVQKAPVQISIQ
ncbi:hypothetical protein KC340_g22 [Hortaea werneckii]|nr:hypothetical protein KC340_g22 [Hortaea werneckii]